MNMKGLITFQRYFVRKLKNIPRQQWVKRPDDAYIPYNQRKLDHLNIKYIRDIRKQEMNKKLQKSSKQNQKQTQTQTETQLNNNQQTQMKPMSPKMGPYTVTNPKIYNKMYRWCACGQSLNQPFCDDSHKGTKFKPYKFSIQQNVKQVDLCGCKLTTKKPFCDGQSCKCTGNKIQNK